VKSVSLPWQFDSVDQIVDCLLAEVSDRTRLLSISHITSVTGIVLPIKKIVDAFQSRGVLVCVDGPHAPAQVELNLNDLGCDFYVASCHKWMSAPFGSGFLYVSPAHQQLIQPLVKSWGRLLPNVPESWGEEFTWTGTRDPSAYLSIPSAIEFLESVGLDDFRQRTRWLAGYAEHRLRELFKTVPIASREDEWYASMAHVPLPAGDWSNLQKRLWEEASIEIPVIHFSGRWFIRVSCHLYNTTGQIDLLVSTLKRWMQ
jgi:isopenicillin-N epimerase